jgi:hypothetical protein
MLGQLALWSFVVARLFRQWVPLPTPFCKPVRVTDAGRPVPGVRVAILHDEVDPAQALGVRQQIGRHGDQVRRQADRATAAFALDTQQLRRFAERPATSITVSLPNTSPAVRGSASATQASATTTLMAIPQHTPRRH